MAEKTEGTDEDATQIPFRDNENLIEETHLQDEHYEVTDKDITETCDIATKFKNFKYLWKKKLLRLGAAIVPDCNEKTPPQNIISGNSSKSVVNMLKDRFSFLQKDTIIDYLSNELIASKRSKS